MPEIAEWLHQLGFGQYAQRFAENDIDFRVLPELTRPDLKLGPQVVVIARNRRTE